ncbi:hypothetical protein JZ751_017590 [Albula glossodonta]|uniref:Uncharacterized protein n=1 Tax=Albula glossodonta TaxID=121402 RepID=A0A8T2PK95_9TELE|nr:hypothetical protein JZ751_017590 [Albula glossodonta]
MELETLQGAPASLLIDSDEDCCSELEDVGGEGSGVSGVAVKTQETGTAVSGDLLTSKEHLLQQVVDLHHPEELDELDLFDHLPGDALQCGQQQKQLAKAAARVVLPVVGVVLQAHLHLVAHALYLAWVAEAFGVWWKIRDRRFSNWIHCPSPQFTQNPQISDQRELTEGGDVLGPLDQHQQLLLHGLTHVCDGGNLLRSDIPIQDGHR